MGWGGTVTFAYKQEVKREREKRGRDEGAERRENHMLAGEELALRWPCRQHSLS